MSIYIKDKGNRVVVAGSVINQQMTDDGYVQYDGVIPSLDAGDYYTLVGGVLTTNTPAAIPPTSVPMRQAQLALNANGQLTTVEAALNGLSEPGRTQSLIEWNTASTVERDNALTAQMAAVLSLDEAELDALFIQAAAL